VTVLSKLAATELSALTRGIGDVHLAISGRVFRTLGPSAAPVRIWHDTVARGTYAAVGGGLRSTALLPLEASPAVLGALNGLIGDQLHAAESPLAIKMAAAKVSEPRLPNVVVWIHGLGETEHVWGYEDLPGWTSVHVRYNTGRAIADNGAELAALIEGFDWPMERIALVGHSMGGLVARSACARGGDWTARVTHTISLGTPHDGAPLAQAVHGLEAVLRVAPETRPFARFLGRRSAGIRDLRRGIRDPLLETARHGFVAATITRNARHPVGRVFGDWLVLSASASGEGDLLALGGAHHLALLNHPEVSAQLKKWLSVVT
jgi:pimeloyl-ACP methyl ester carboxylesterase